MSDLVPPKSVQQAIAGVMAELPNIGKGDKSPEGYAYRGIEAVTKHVQPLFAKHGVVIVPGATITEVRPSPAMKEGWQDVYMRVEWTIVGPDGSTLQASTTGIGRDRSDKGANKAQTQAYKYLLLHLLCIADGKDDSDGQTYEQDRADSADVAAQRLGWASAGEQAAAFERLRSETATDEVKTWVKSVHITKLTMTADQANEWSDHIDRAAASV